MARFVGDEGEGTLQAHISDFRLVGLVDIKAAKYSLDELQQAQEQATFLVRSLGFEADSFVDVIENRVEIRVADGADVEGTLAKLNFTLPPAVQIVSGVELMKPEALFHGGQAISTCTLGFSVRSGSGTRGVTTAAHCGNSQRWNGKTLRFQSERYRDNYDIQWHTSPGDTVSNRFEAGTGTRRCTATRSRRRQSVGSYVCKNGRTTGYRCGYIQSKNFAPSYVPSVNRTFVYVDGRSTNLSEGGDSGGPWFNGSTAYGGHSGGAGNDSIYMPINYVSGIGVSILTN